MDVSDTRSLAAGPAGDATRTATGPGSSTIAAEVPAPEIPGYEVLEELGRGGMGIVYKARQIALDRVVALKTIAPTAGPAALARFLAEAAAMAAVRHPRVLEVYDFGDRTGAPYIALEYCPGGSLSGVLRPGRPLPPREAAALVEKVARGVAAAHEQGIVHRDLKPGNVLLDAAGEPKVADFGLAKRGGVDLTRTGAVIGTPAYLAPEQAIGGAKFVGPGADVWALGVILYETLTGRRPFAAEDVGEVVRQVVMTSPISPRKLVPAVSRDLDRICLHCLEKQPLDRYSTAAAVADDLRRFAEGKPISVRPPGPLGRTYKWVRRNPLPTAIGLLLALAAVGTSASAVVAIDRERQRSVEAAARFAAEASVRDEHQARLWSDVQIALQNGRLREVVAAIDRAADDGLPVTPEMRLTQFQALIDLDERARTREVFGSVPIDTLPPEVRGQFELWQAIVLAGEDEAESQRLLDLAATRPLPAADRAFVEGLQTPSTPAAIEKFRQAIRLNRLHFPARARAAALLLFLNRADEAVDLASESIALSPDFPSLWLTLTDAYALKGDGPAFDRAMAQVRARGTAEEVAMSRVLGLVRRDAISYMRMSAGYPVLTKLRRESTETGEAEAVDLKDLLANPSVRARASRLLATLSSAQREGIEMYLEFTVSSLDNLAFARWFATPGLADRLEAVTSRHPEGCLLLVELVVRLQEFVKFTRPEYSTKEEPARALRKAIDAADRAAATPGILIGQDMAADFAIMLRGLLGDPIAFGDRADPTVLLETADLLRRRLSTWGEVPAGKSDGILRVCLVAKELTLAREVLEAWERQNRTAAEPARWKAVVEAMAWRARIEFAADGYLRALWAAEYVLASGPDPGPIWNHPSLSEIRDSCRRRLVPLDVAPPPRVVTR